MSLYTTSTNGVLIGWDPPRTIEENWRPGPIQTNETSEYFVKAVASTSTVNLVYKLGSYENPDPQEIISGLPEGLTLAQDGTIIGSTAIDLSNINLERKTYGFSVDVFDNNQNLLIASDFLLDVDQVSTNTNFTSIFCKPLMTSEKRASFSQFINNNKIFIPNLIYRPFDKKFGVQKELRMIIDFGIEKLPLSEYVEILSKNFYRRRYQLGEIKTAVCKFDNNGPLVQPTYEIIFVEVIDKYNNSKYQSIPKEFSHLGTTYYPSTVENMRLQIRENAVTDNHFDPKFTKNAQSSILNQGNFGYFKFIPLCYTYLGKSKIIIDKIKQNGFKFNLLDFDIDRVYIEEPLDNTETKYLLLNNLPKLQ
jgi:hypothetical protein